VYVYAFPIQQLLALIGAPRFGLIGYTFLSLIGTFALAVPSWHLVERPALALKDARLTLVWPRAAKSTSAKPSSEPIKRLAPPRQT
jgi:peptidoglycan/LPS O-acetylase OafA/YrhL